MRRRQNIYAKISGAGVNISMVSGVSRSSFVSSGGNSIYPYAASFCATKHNLCITSHSASSKGIAPYCTTLVNIKPPVIVIQNISYRYDNG